MKDFPQRSQSQNKALHLWCEQIAEEWNNSGYEQKLTFGTINAPWTKEIVKVFFKKIAYAMYEKKSTTELTTKELTEVAKVLERELGEAKTGVPFPNIAILLHNQE